MQLAVIAVKRGDAPTLAFWQPLEEKLGGIRQISKASEPLNFELLSQRFGCYEEFLLLDMQTVGTARQCGLLPNVVGGIDTKELAST